MNYGPQCICEKSECLQRYCHCFEARYFCTEECSCHGCRNTADNADEVEERADSILKKRPDAFKTKITTDAADGSGLEQQQQQQEARVHVKGCNCRKSECKKLYCECFKHQVGCSAKCQCTGCANEFGVKGAAETDTDSPTAGDWSDWGVDFVPQTRAMGDGGLEAIFQHLKDGGKIQHNVDPQTHQGFADGSPSNDANSTAGSIKPLEVSAMVPRSTNSVVFDLDEAGVINLRP